MSSSTIQKLDFTKPITTRDGQPVRVLCTDRKSGTSYTVTALVLEDGVEQVIHYTPEGACYSNRGYGLDLINPKKKLYLLAWAGSIGDTVCSYPTEEAREDAIGVCKRHNWPVLKTLEIELD